ncbi:MAG: hypothetical protein J0I40_05665 [Cellulomonas sp.]|uniref:hypothetical protein n=1 Tax=Cellulomonas sp. 73-92 TaxID=1895740 RepID=UPI00092BAC6A|nr:hypothetical protein [Cellulomonas sp. 73-92]MBN9374870.1 hypothetical protein [Cellulomonas sp.]OJV75946.1 MAG: hypothetical protein BGO37_06835 [Cellulomonas sp. 73-92]
MKGKKVIGGALAGLLAVPLLVVGLGAPAQAAACWSGKASTTLFTADASVDYGTCTHGSTRSYARVGSASFDTGWYQGSTWAHAAGVGSREAYYQVSSDIG